MANYEKFAQLLSERNIKSVDVSRATGIYTSTFSDWKTGRSNPKMDKLQKIATYFNVPVEYFSDQQTLSNTKSKKKIPKDLKTILDNEEITLNGRLMSPGDKEKMFRIIEAAYWDAKEMNKKKKD